MRFSIETTNHLMRLKAMPIFLIITEKMLIDLTSSLIKLPFSRYHSYSIILPGVIMTTKFVILLIIVLTNRLKVASAKQVKVTLI